MASTETYTEAAAETAKSESKGRAEKMKASKMFGKIRKPISKEEYQEDLLGTDYETMTRSVTGDADSEELSFRKKHLAKLLAKHKKLCYSEAQLEDVKKNLKKSGDKSFTIYEVDQTVMSGWRRKKIMF